MPRRPHPGVDAEGEDDGDQSEEPEALHAVVAVPDRCAHHEDGDHPDSEEAEQREGGALVSAEEVHDVGEAGTDEPVHEVRRMVDDRARRRIGPRPAHQVGGAGEEVPEGIGEQDGGQQRRRRPGPGSALAHGGGRLGASSGAGPAPAGRSRSAARTAKSTSRASTSTLTKNWTTVRIPRAVPTSNGDRRRRTKSSSRQPTIKGTRGQQPEVGVAEGQADQHEGGEAEEQAADEGGGCPRRPPAEQPEHGQGRERGRDQVDEVERGNRAEDPGDRSRGDAQGQRVGHHVDAVGIEELRRVEGVESVAQRVGGPLDHPEREGGVTTSAGGDRAGVRQHVPPQDDRHGQVGGASVEACPPGRRLVCGTKGAAGLTAGRGAALGAPLSPRPSLNGGRHGGAKGGSRPASGQRHRSHLVTVGPEGTFALLKAREGVEVVAAGKKGNGAVTAIR